MHLMQYVLLETIAGRVNVQLVIQGIHTPVVVEKVRNFVTKKLGDQLNFLLYLILLHYKTFNLKKK